ncbi:MAG: TSUP family transporter [Bradymonadia bacterium]
MEALNSSGVELAIHLALSGALGVLAGLITTVAGMGGGLMLVTALAVFWGPSEALAATALALWVGNLHRVLLFRRSVSWPVARAWVLGAFPGAIIGGLLVVNMSEGFIRACILTLTVLALTRVAGWWSWQPPAWALTPAGLGVGTLCGASGGAGVLSGPLLMASGLSGAAYVATNAVGSVAMHTGRIGAYASGGMFPTMVLWSGITLAVCITLGNLLGVRVRAWLGVQKNTRVEVGVLSGCVALAVLGF